MATHVMLLVEDSPVPDIRLTQEAFRDANKLIQLHAGYRRCGSDGVSETGGTRMPALRVRTLFCST